MDRGKVGAEPGHIASEHGDFRHLSVRADEEIGEGRESNAAGSPVAAKGASGQERCLVGELQPLQREFVQPRVQGSVVPESDGNLRVDDWIDSHRADGKCIAKGLFRPATPRGVSTKDVEQNIRVSEKHSVFPAGKAHHLVGRKPRARYPGDSPNAFLDEFALAQQRTDHGCSVSFLETDLGPGKQSELASQTLGDGHLALGRDLHAGSMTLQSLTGKILTFLPAVLRDAGYHTSIAGKWHLGQAADQSPPTRGFDRSFVLLTGAASHFEDAAPVDTLDDIHYRRDGEIVPALPEGFYSTRAYTDELIGYLREAKEAGKPFFALGTYTAPHWPLQVPDEFLDLYAGAYDGGWEELAGRRVAGAKRAGVIPEDAVLPPLPNYSRRWDELSGAARPRAGFRLDLEVSRTCPGLAELPRHRSPSLPPGGPARFHAEQHQHGARTGDNCLR